MSKSIEELVKERVDKAYEEFYPKAVQLLHDELFKKTLPDDALGGLGMIVNKPRKVKS